ncbi:toll/interleukin-1 receptor domain-containing protein [Kibdelosporangium aridum]|uniref:toll/interleukin-1 receptor domain-containing protein n=1 Tax=Kibdelosporangium aridum TaxID=2030 RepID=UPI00055D5F00|nr:toll/interleukin-1 receptor domain-containing protein [Kibdelosporangium aridum]
MLHRIKAARPRVFLSFAGNNRDQARLLAKEFKTRGFDAFVDDDSIPLGRDVVIAINNALSQYDYFVLLWSRHAVDRRWVELEWAAALAREISERRSFVFVVLLDDTDPPLVLSPRRYLTARDGWAKVAKELVGAWQRDQRLDMPVLPAPYPQASEGLPMIVIHVRNRALKVAHVLPVLAGTTGAELLGMVRSALALPQEEKAFDGIVGMRFTYELRNGDDPRSPLQITDGALIDLEVCTEWFDGDGPVASRTYRTRPNAGVTPKMAEAALTSTFRHLLPQ